MVTDGTLGWSACWIKLGSRGRMHCMFASRVEMDTCGHRRAHARPTLIGSGSWQNRVRVRGTGEGEVRMGVPHLGLIGKPGVDYRQALRAVLGLEMLGCPPLCTAAVRAVPPAQEGPKEQRW
jgi:hypothetical protein